MTLSSVTSEATGPARCLRDRVLLRVVGQLGHRVDVLDVTHFEGMSVASLILHFENATPKASPAEVRGALHELLDAKHIAPSGLDTSGGFMKAWSEVRPTSRGVVAARALEPDCGRPPALVTFVTRHGEAMLNARFDTKDEDRDKELNASGTVFAVALIVLVLQPTAERPLFADECVPLVEKLIGYGVRPRPGPRPEKDISVDAIMNSLDKLGPLFGLKRQHLPEDKRRDCYYLEGRLPEIRICAGDRQHCGDWEGYRHLCWLILNDELPGKVVEPERHLFPAGRPTAKQRKRAGRAAREPHRMQVEDLAAPKPENEVTD